MKVPRSLAAVLTGAAMLAAGWIATSSASAQEVVTSEASTHLVTEADWSAARKAKAQPMPLREVTGVPQPAPPSALPSAREPGGVAGRPPASMAATARGFRRGLGTSAGSVDVEPHFGLGSTVWYAYPPPFSLEIPILDYLTVPLYPVTALGKLFFSDGVFDYVCSASSITSEGAWGAGNGQTVVTAGHCCSDGAGTWYQDWLFEPAHIAGTAPFGSWTAASAKTFTAWHTGEDLSRDVCVLQMNNLGGQTINDAVGALGYAYDQPLPQQYRASGWPQAAPFDGRFLFLVSASDAETDTTQAGQVPFTHGIGCPLTPGASGGAWILKYQSWMGSNQFNGLNSYKYNFPNRPLEMFGPYIDSVVINNLLMSVATQPPAP